LCAASEALASSGLGIDEMKQVGVAVGTAVGGISEFAEASETKTARGFSRISPKSVTKFPSNMTAYSIAEAFGTQGYCFTLTDACASGAKALHMAADAILLGHAEIMLVVGTEASLTAVGLGSFYNNGALSKRFEDPESISRPFDVDRDGFVMSEGAAAVILESRESAARRGVLPLASVLGHAFANDGSNAMAPTEDGLIQAETMHLALATSGLAPSDIGLIIPHATSTDTGDRAEANSYRLLWPERTPPISAVKASFGHTVGAAGLIEAIVAILAIETGIAPPTRNFVQADPCSEHLDIVTEPRDIELDYAMNVSNGIGGINSVGVFGRVREAT
jgi:3-oxoacyl-[acyl-carrier-protein] synthase II